VSIWDAGAGSQGQGSWKHYVNDTDFNDFTSFEYGKTYEIYVTKAGGISFTVTGKSPATDITHQIKAGDNFISPEVKQPESISQLLGAWGLALGTDLSDIKRWNAETQSFESYAAGAFTQFEPGKGYNIVGLTTANFSYGKTETTTTFVYDSTGSRVKKTAGSTTTVYLGKDYDIAGSTSTKYIFLGDRRLATKDSSGALLFTHEDHISSSNVITDSSGNQAALLEYDPYGSTVTHTGSANPKHKYTGQEEDDSTKLYYYGARYYDPVLGRFVSADWTIKTTSDPQALNRYAYARNNPVIYTDPTGNFFIIDDIIMAAIAIAQAVAAAYSAATAAVATYLASAGLAHGLSIVAANIIVGAAVGATLGAADGSINGRGAGKGAAFGAIGGAISGGIVGPGGSALSQIADKMGLGIAVGIARVGLGSYQTYQAVRDKSYFSGAFAAINTIATATVVADQIYATVTEPTTPEDIVANKNMQKEFERAWADSEAYNDQKRHEEGGWIRKKPFGKLDVSRWPAGGMDWIQPTFQPRNAIYDFHTHPNYGPHPAGGEWNLGPSPPDIRGATVPGFIINKDEIVHYDHTGEKQKWPR